MTRKLRVAAVIVGLIALAVAAAAVVLDKSLPYRIGPDNYARYVWVGRLFIAALIACAFAIGLGFTWRQLFAIIAGVCGVLAVLSVGGPHAGASPKTWCYNNLRALDAAKQELAGREALANGAVIVAAEMAPLIERGIQSLRCYAGGVYVIGPVGIEPRCSIHGSLSDNPRRKAERRQHRASMEGRDSNHQGSEGSAVCRPPLPLTSLAPGPYSCRVLRNPGIDSQSVDKVEPFANYL